jgi:group I intron endonuclease
MKSGIYQISINSKTYIGSATNIYNRKHRHLHDLKNNKHCNGKLQNYFNKYGIENLLFEVIEVCDIESLLIREQYFIDSKKPFFNICKIAGKKSVLKILSANSECFRVSAGIAPNVRGFA